MAVKIKKKYLILLLVLAIILLYLFWGPLFPWSPIKIGYTKISSSKVTIYVDDITENDSVVYRIQEILDKIEEFHGLHYVNNFRIVVLGAESNNKRYLPWLNGSGYSVSLSPLNLIYIGANARKSPFGIEPHLKHELSHLLIDQNTSFSKAMMIHKQVWLVEGIAEYFSNHSFKSKSDLINLVKQDYVQLPTIKEKSPQNMSWEELQLEYSYYNYFIEFLVESHGLERLQEFIKMYINEPENYRELFVKVYSIDLNEILKSIMQI